MYSFRGMLSRQSVYKIIEYDEKDPRYNLIIDDSNEQNRQIHPQNVVMKCSKCSKDRKLFNNRCDIKLSKPSDSFKRFKAFKKQNQHAIIDQTLIATPHINDNLFNNNNYYGNQIDINEKRNETCCGNDNDNDNKLMYLDDSNWYIYCILICFCIVIYMWINKKF